MVKMCQNCGNRFERRSNAKYCSLTCQRQYLSRRWHLANRERGLIANRKRRADPARWEAEKARARARSKTPKWRAYWREYSKQFRGKTIHGRVVSLNAHVHSRKQSNLYVDWREVKEKFGEVDSWVCAYCGTVKDMTFDHIIPFTFNGKHTVDNLQLLCRSCNSKKGDEERWKQKTYVT